MQYVIAITPLNPMRAESSHRSEMVSQLLFGEIAEILDVGKDFSHIRTIFDNYTGWVQNIQLSPIAPEFLLTNFKGYSANSSVIFINHQPATIFAGTPVWETTNFGEFIIDYNEVEVVAQNDFTSVNLKQIAFPYLNASYLWGGRSTAGVDCSGFVQQVYKNFSINLPRDTYLQADIGSVVGFLEEGRIGDLAFFDNEAGKIIHVGILLENNTILHASGRVRIDKIDVQGIVNKETSERTHTLRIIKRIT